MICSRKRVPSCTTGTEDYLATLETFRLVGSSNVGCGLRISSPSIARTAAKIRVLLCFSSYTTSQGELSQQGSLKASRVARLVSCQWSLCACRRFLERIPLNSLPVVPLARQLRYRYASTALTEHYGTTEPHTMYHNPLASQGDPGVENAADPQHWPSNDTQGSRTRLVYESLYCLESVNGLEAPACPGGPI